MQFTVFLLSGCSLNYVALCFPSTKFVLDIKEFILHLSFLDDVKYNIFCRTFYRSVKETVKNNIRCVHIII